MNREEKLKAITYILNTELSDETKVLIIKALLTEPLLSDVDETLGY